MDGNEFEEKVLDAKKIGKEWFKKIKRWATIVAFIALIAVAVFFVYKYKTSTGTHVTTEELGAYIKNIGELATAEYDYTMCQVTQKDNFIISTPLTSTKIIYSYSGTIKAGIQFSDVKISVSEKKKIVYITLPDAEILSTEIDQDSLKIYDEQQGLFSKTTMTDFNEAQIELKEKARESALEKGLLESAEANAETLLTQMISSLVEPEGYKVSVK
jgi:hypothetical protein